MFEAGFGRQRDLGAEVAPAGLTPTDAGLDQRCGAARRHLHHHASGRDGMGSIRSDDVDNVDCVVDLTVDHDERPTGAVRSIEDRKGVFACVVVALWHPSEILSGGIGEALHAQRVG